MTTSPATPEPVAEPPSAPGGQVGAIIRAAPLAAALYTPAPELPASGLGPLRALRDRGPTYPIYVVPEFAKITLFEEVGENKEDIISVAPADLPQGFADRTT